MAAIPDVRGMLGDLNRAFTHEELAALIAQESGEPICTATVGRYIDGSRKRIPFTTGWAVMVLHKRNWRALKTPK